MYSTGPETLQEKFTLTSAFSKDELAEALHAIRSMIMKCEKARPKLREGSAQATLLRRRIRALEIAAALIGRELERDVTP